LASQACRTAPVECDRVEVLFSSCRTGIAQGAFQTFGDVFDGDLVVQ
jgi:hypothetical protein